MSMEEIRTMIAALGNIRLVLADARDKAEVYQKLDLRLTYQPAAHKVQAEANCRPGTPWGYESCPRGD
jgi:hypothetical protein